MVRRLRWTFKVPNLPYITAVRQSVKNHRQYVASVANKFVIAFSQYIAFRTQPEVHPSFSSEFTHYPLVLRSRLAYCTRNDESCEHVNIFSRDNVWKYARLRRDWGRYVYYYDLSKLRTWTWQQELVNLNDINKWDKKFGTTLAHI